VTRLEKGPLTLLWERMYLLLIVVAASGVASLLVSQAMPETYRGITRGYLPLVGDTFGLSSEDANIPKSPKLPTSDTNAQTALKGILDSAELRAMAAEALGDIDTEYLRKWTDFEIDKFNFLDIIAWHRNPETAARIANTYMQVFQEHITRTLHRDVDAKLEALRNGLNRAEAREKELEQERLDYMKGLGTVDYSAELQALIQRKENILSEIQTIQLNLDSQDETIAQIQAQMQTREAELQGLNASHLPPGNTVPAGFILSGQSYVQNSRIKELQGQIGQTRQQIEQLLIKYTEAHPRVVEARTSLTVLEAELAEQTERELGSLSFGKDEIYYDLVKSLNDAAVQRASDQAKLAILQDRLAELEQELQAMPEYKMRLDAYERQLTDLRQTMSEMRAREQEMEVWKLRNATYIEVMDPALPESEPKLPNTKINLVVALILGVILGVVLIVVSERIHEHREAAPW